MIARTRFQILLAGGCVVAVAALCAATYWTFLSRLLTFPLTRPITSVDWYRPKEPVPGGFGLPIASQSPDARAEIASDVLEQAAHWADTRQSAALLVMLDGRIVLERYWRGYDRDRPTNSYSMAKTLLGLLVGVAESEGAIASVRDPVHRYLPAWSGDGRERITLEDLLRMQSGLLYDYDQTNPLSDMVQVHLAVDLRPTIFAMRPDRPPGEQFEYNNLNSQLLGLALEAAVQVRYAEYLSTRLWAPLGASDAAVWVDREGGNAKTYCCLFATARDWARVGEMLRLGGKTPSGRVIVPEAWLDRMLEPSPLQPKYGYHIWLHDDADRVGSIPSYFYLDGGKKQRVYVLRNERLVIVRTGEQPDGWDETYLPRTLVKGLRRGS